MTDANGWPDEARPGVPLNPERDGWHIVNGGPKLWDAGNAEWKWNDGVEVFRASPKQAARQGWNYKGPLCIITPAEHSAALAAQAVAMREACADEATAEALECGQRGDKSGMQAASNAASDIRALPIPHEPALAALLAAERAAGVREGMEKAAGIARDYECSHPHLPDAIARAITAAVKDQPA